MARSSADLPGRIAGRPVVRAMRAERFLDYVIEALGVGLAAVFTYWSTTGSGRFRIWSQILDFESVPLTSFQIFSQAHGLRYGLVRLTVLAPAEHLGMDAVRLLGFVVAICLVWTAVLVRAAASETVGRRLPAWGFAIMSSWIALSFFMNGRLAFGFLGHAIALWALVRWVGGKAPVAVLALLLTVAVILSSVSSGQLFVLVVSSSICLLVAVPSTPHGRVLRARARALVIVGLAVLSPLLTLLVLKNLDFFGGGLGSIVPMLDHGWGRFALLAGPVGAILFPTTAVVWAILSLRLLRRAASHRPDHLVLMVVVLSAVAVGSYGYSTLLAGLPAAMVLALDRSQKLMQKSAPH